VADSRVSRRGRSLGDRRPGKARNRPRLEGLEERTLLANPAISVVDVAVVEGNPGPAAVSGSLIPGLEIDAYRINARAGQRLFFDATGFSSTSGTWSLTGPGGQAIGSAAFGTDFTANLPVDGAYTLTLSGNLAAGDITYAFTVTDVSDAPLAPTGFGAVNSGPLAGSSQAVFNYNASAGMAVFLDSLDRDFDSVNFEVRDPLNNLLVNQSASNDAGPFYLPRSGVYTVTARNFSTGPGDFAFRLLDLATAPTIAADTPVAAPFGQPFQTDVFRFAGQPGQRLMLDGLDDDFESDLIFLTAPSLGTALLNFASSSDDSNPVTLREPGTYFVTAADFQGAPGADYDFRLLEADPIGALGAGLAEAGTLGPRESRLVTFTAPAGTSLVIDDNRPFNNFNLQYTLFNADNASIGSGFGDFEVALPTAGTYSLRITGFGGDPQPFDLDLLPRTTNAPTALALNSMTTGALDRAESDVFTFAGTVGQRILFDAIDDDPLGFEDLRATLFAPSGAAARITTLSILFQNQQATSDVGPLTLLETGTYRLVFSSIGTAAGDYGFRLLDAASAPIVTPNLQITAALSPSGLESDLYRFNGVAGQRFTFDSLGITPSFTANWRLVGPDNFVVANSNSSLNFDFDVTLPATGQYLLVVQGFFADPVDYSFQIVEITTETTPLDFGVVYGGAIDVPGQEDVFAFNGTAGQTLYFDALQNTFGPVNARLVQPNGSTIRFFGAFDSGPFTLPVSGAYRLIFDSPGAEITGTYQFRLADVVLGLPVGPGSSLTGTLAPGLLAEIFRLDATAGQFLFFDSQLATAGATLRVFDPLNNQVTAFSTNGDLGVDFARTGTYTLVVSGEVDPGTVPFDIDILEPTTGSATLTIGATTTGTFNAPGQRFVYEFFSPGGGRVYYDALDDDGDQIAVRLVTPDGIDLFQFNALAEFDQGPATLRLPGVYRLIVGGTQDDPGSYAFRLLDATPLSLPALALVGDTSVSFATGLEAVLFRVDRDDFAPGTLVQFDGQLFSSPAVDGTFSLFGAGSTDVKIFGESFTAGDPVGLLLDDLDYTLVASGSGGPGGFDFTTTTTPPATALAGFGIQSGTLPAFGQAAFAFDAPAGAPIYFDTLNPFGNFGIQVEIFDPSSNPVSFTFDATNDIGPIFLTAGGTYQVVLTETQGFDNDFNYSLRALAVEAISITPGLVVDDSAPFFEADVYVFDGIPGQRLYVDLLEQNFNSLNFRLVGPGSNDQLFGGFIDSFADSLVPPLPEFGPYYLIVDGFDGFNADYSFRLLDLANDATPTALGDTETGELNLPGIDSVDNEADLYTFTATAGQRIFVELTDVFDPGTLDPLFANGRVRLFGPEGFELNGLFSLFGGDSFRADLTTDGLYTIAITGENNFTPVGYSFRTVVEAVDAETPLTFGTTYAGTIAGEAEQDAFTFTALAGQKLFYDALDGDFDDVRVDLFGPTGQTFVFFFGGSNASSDRGPFTLDESGEYRLVVRNGSLGSTGDYMFRLLDVSSTPPTPFATTVNASLGDNQAQVVTIDGVGGTRIGLDALAGSSTSSSTEWTLFDPSDQFVASASRFSDDFFADLPTTGRYTLVLQNFNSTTEAANFSVRPPTFSNQILTPGTPVAGSLNEVGEIDEYIFAGAAGQTFVYDALTNAANSVTFTLVTPSGRTFSDGQTSQGNQSITALFAPFTLIEPGTYRLRVSGTATPSTYSFNLIDLAAPPSQDLAADTAVTSTLTALEADVYRFAGTAGQRFLFDSFGVSPSSSANWRLFGPDDRELIGLTTLGNDFEVTLTQTGTHRLVLNSTITPGLVNYSIRARTVVDTVSAYTLGTAQAGTIAEPGERDVYTFTGATGQQLIVDSIDSDSSFESITYTLIGPSGQPVRQVGGSQIAAIAHTSNVGPFTLTEPGTYQLIFDGGGDATGDYNFRVLDAAAQPLIALGTTELAFVVSLSEASDDEVRVTVATASGTATAGSDYFAIPPTELIFFPGETSKTVIVQVVRDTAFEADETLFLDLSAATGGTIGDAQGQGTILNDDGVSIFVDNVTAPEGSGGGTTPFTFTVSLSGSSGSTVTVDVFTQNGSAVAPGDFASIPATTLTFLPGETTQTVTVNVVADDTAEPTEAFSLRLTNATGGSILDDTGTGTILNDDASISINNVSLAEGDAGTTAFTFTISLSQSVAQTVTVVANTANGTAAAPGDYAAIAGQTVTFNPGETSKTVTVLVNGDLDPEANETFFVNLSGAVGATIADAQGQGTILNDDRSVSIDDVALAEGNAGTTAFNFTVSLSETSASNVTVDVNTSGFTATSGVDFQALSTTATILAGQLTTTVTVLVNGDLDPEGLEQFFVNLSGPTGAVIGDGTGIGSIQNDDASLSISNGSAIEGNAGTTSMAFDVTLSLPVAQTVSVHLRTIDGTATAASLDYAAIGDQIVTFNPGDTLRTITVTVNGDTTPEADESFTVELFSPTGAPIADGTGLGIIRNDDTVASIADAQLVEGNSGTTDLLFVVTLSVPSAQAVSVVATTAGFTATSGVDFTAVTTTVNFAPGATTQTVAVPIVGDLDAEANESFFVNLSSPVNTAIGDSQGVGSILNDDASISVDNASVVEGNAGTVNAVFTVTLTQPVAQAVTVKARTINGTAVAPGDFVALTDNLITFNPGETSKTFSVTVNGDTTGEPTENFTVELFDNLGAPIADGTGLGTIQNDDAELTVADVAVTEGNAGTVNAVFTVTLTQSVAQPVTVNARTVDGTATSPSDFAAITSLQLTFAPGETTKTVTVAVNGDATPEAFETFLLELFSPVGASIADGTATGTIQNDDAAFTIADASTIEGDSGTSVVGLSITIPFPVVQALIVTASTADGTATSPSDYTGFASTNIDFAPGETTKILQVFVNGDTTPEADETFTVNLSNPTGGATIAGGTATVTIVNDDATLSVADVTLAEGNAGTTAFHFTVTLSNPVPQTVTVTARTIDGTASSPADFAAIAGQLLTFAPGELSKTVTVLVNGDATTEPTETFTVELLGASGATIADATATGTILNDDGGLSVADVAVVEGNAGTTNAQFTIGLSQPVAQTVTVRARTIAGTAAAGTDFVAIADQLVTFAPGETSQTVTVLVNGDATPEAFETFLLELFDPSGASIANPTATGTIQNDDAAFTIGDLTQLEGNAGTTSFVFTVSTPFATIQAISVVAATADGTAGSPGDFAVGGPTTLSFAPGETSKTFTVAVVGDTVPEAFETFAVNLSGATGGAAIADGAAVGTIQNDDAAIGVTDVTVIEGNAGTTPAGFLLTIPFASALPVSLTVQTTGSTATSGTDFTALPATVITFAPGETSKPVNVAVVGDATAEPHESFALDLSGATNATIADAQGVGTILNDDAAFTITDATIIEGNAGTTDAVFTIAIAFPVAQAVTVDYQTADGTAVAPGDYTAIPLTTLLFAPGVTSQTISVPVVGDGAFEADETFNVNLSNPTGGATIADAQGVGTIQNDDMAVTAFDVQRGSAGRSFVRYADLTLSTSVGLATIIASVNDADPTNDRIQLIGRGLDGAGNSAVSLAGKLAAVDRVIAADFGAQGITGAAGTTAGDGYYEFRLDLDDDGTFETVRRFFRLLGDVNGDGRVTDTTVDSDVSLVNAALGLTGVNLPTDVNGDGQVDSFNDRRLARRSVGRFLTGGLGLDD